jgi:hypothetical protein
MRQVGVKSSGRRRHGSLATAMKSSPLDWLLVVACGLLLLGHGGHSAAATATVHALCNQPPSAMPIALRTFCSWALSRYQNELYRSGEWHFSKRFLFLNFAFQTLENLRFY